MLPLVLLVGISWAALLGIGRGEPIQASELPRLVVSTLVPQSVTPVVPETRLTAKPSPAAFFLFVAAIVGLLFGTGRCVRWPAATGMGSAATPSLLLHTVRGRAPPRLPA
ncbi:hypothetical protein Ari01nite_89000 [Paractinoplanes rishiriensis]|uniref:Uncharacterized protein n=1 Tax=Paractinoplanes rishiriensis TaxID=1050105 RepID=A0A919N1H0_9ACTN|nr:hypothetical protein Ari01nite_89000 [Actinoplanes rishiriensis]